MSYDPRSITVVGDRSMELSISLETDDLAGEPNPSLYPQFLFVPDLSKPDHWHVPISRAEAEALRDWLNHYLGN